MRSIYHRVYLTGYSGAVMPRRLRRLIAGSELHRAWLIGYMGFFRENGIAYGPAHKYPAWTDPA